MKTRTLHTSASKLLALLLALVLIVGLLPGLALTAWAIPKETDEIPAEQIEGQSEESEGQSAGLQQSLLQTALQTDSEPAEQSEHFETADGTLFRNPRTYTGTHFTIACDDEGNHTQGFSLSGADKVTIAARTDENITKVVFTVGAIQENADRVKCLSPSVTEITDNGRTITMCGINATSVTFGFDQQGLFDCIYIHDVTVYYGGPLYALSYNVSGGTVVEGDAKLVHGTTHLPDQLPTLTKYASTFGGWFTDGAMTREAVPGAEITENTTLYAKWTVSSAVLDGDVVYRKWDHEKEQMVDAVVNENDYILVNSTNNANYAQAHTEVTDGRFKWLVIDGDVTFDARIPINGEANIILKDGATLVLAKGIRVGQGATLNIYGQSETGGKLSAMGSGFDAAIGSDGNYTAGTIVIEGGAITALGEVGAGIGGGMLGGGGTITIRGGAIHAESAGGGAAIGGGAMAKAGATITITGGMIIASASQDVAGIGGGLWFRDSATVKSTVPLYGSNESLEARTAMPNTDGVYKTLRRFMTTLVPEGVSETKVETTLSGAAISNLAEVMAAEIGEVPQDAYIETAVDMRAATEEKPKALTDAVNTMTTSAPAAVETKYLEISIEKYVTTVTDDIGSGTTQSTEMSEVTELKQAVEIKIPLSSLGITSSPNDVMILRQHGDKTLLFAPLAAKPATGNFKDGTSYYDKAEGNVYIYSQYFSTFAVMTSAKTIMRAGDNSSSNSSSYDNSGSSGDDYYYPGSSYGGSSSSGSSGGTVVAQPKPSPTPTLVETPPAETPAPVQPVFSDVPGDAWYYDDVYFLAERGLMTGTSEDGTEFSPNTPLSRGMLVTILYRLSGDEDPQALKEYPFADVAEGSYYQAAIAWSYAHDVVNGYGDGLFGPDDIVTREQMAAILYRYALGMGYDVTIGDDTPAQTFADCNTVSDYALGSIEWVVEHGIISGRPDNTIDPLSGSIRAEAAAMLARFIRGYNL